MREERAAFHAFHVSVVKMQLVPRARCARRHFRRHAGPAAEPDLHSRERARRSVQAATGLACRRRIGARPAWARDARTIEVGAERDGRAGQYLEIRIEGAKRPGTIIVVCRVIGRPRGDGAAEGAPARVAVTDPRDCPIAARCIGDYASGGRRALRSGARPRSRSVTRSECRNRRGNVGGK
jgi:hypothetical protein